MELVHDGQESASKEVHLLPCKIHFDGGSNFSKYILIDNDEAKKMKSTSIHGRPLNGTDIKLPENFKGLFMSKSKSGSDKVFVTSTFESFTAWNYDKHPSKNDAAQKVWDWISIAEVLHADDDEDSA
ncbi:uncharacterized protein LOC132200014 [Neocloeon triangulifer]|uniref:uncharacterized protein LOC132200014 n=1 Tax=Neocloeon triangulifer TaxID=2078957 RepID=UPI00286FA4D9|nr:uncharacterized protein LOC132200014 [Neocloeon triangulifer]